MTFFRMLQHLLPSAIAWRTFAGKRLTQLIEGLSGAQRDAVAFVDDVYDDLDPQRTRELAKWERQKGLAGTGTEAERRLALEAAWAATGGQSPSYLQGVMQAAGFDVYVHEWWSSGPGPYVARDPRDYTELALIGGTVQCGEPLARCGEPSAQCNRFLANDVGYLVNKNLTNVAPPPIPNDPLLWRYFLYWGGPTFPERAPITAARRAEFEALLLKICPAEQWLVTRTYDPDAVQFLTMNGEQLTMNGIPLFI